MNSKFSVIVTARPDDDVQNLIVSLEDNELGHFDLVVPRGMPSMGSGYNVGVAQAKTDLLIFTHVDVCIWAGPMLWADMLNKLENEATGFLGVAGSSFLPENCAWWDHTGPKAGAVTHTDGKVIYTSTYGPYGPVAVLDGVFLACHRRVLDKLGPWPEDLGFHFYDIEMSLKANVAGFQNEVIPLPLFHGSVGNLGPEWDKSRQTFLSRRNKL